MSSVGKIKKKTARRGDDGYKIVSVRMKDELIEKLDGLQNEDAQFSLNYVCPANYKENSYLDRTVKLIIKTACLVSELEALEEKQTTQAEEKLLK